MSFHFVRIYGVLNRTIYMKGKSSFIVLIGFVD